MAKWQQTLSAAHDHLEGGRTAQAISLMEAAKKGALEGLGADHLSVAQICGDLANAFIWHAGERDRAADELATAARILKKQPDHFRLLGPLADVALNLAIIGRRPQALRLARRADRIFGDASSHSLNTKRAQTRNAISDYLLALNIIGLPDAMRKVVERVAAPAAKKNQLAYFELDEIQLLAMVCDRTAQRELAATYYTYAASRLADESDAEAFNFGAVLAQIAEKLEDFELVGNALTLYHQAKLVQQHIFGHDHPVTLWATTRLVQKYIEYGEFKKASMIVLGESERGNRHRPDHPDKAAFFAFLGYYSRLLGDLDEAQLLLTRGVRMMERLYGWDSPKLAPALLDLGRVYQDREDFFAAIRHMRRSLELQMSEKQPDLELLLETFEWLVATKAWEESAAVAAIGKMTVFEQRESVDLKKIVRRQQAGVRRVEGFYRQALKVLARHEGPNGRQAMQMTVAMADFHAHFQLLDKAKKLLEKLWPVLEKKGDDFPLVRVIVAGRLGVLYRLGRATRKAQTFLLRAIEAAAALDPEQAAYHRADNHRELARVFLARHDQPQALQHFETAISLYVTLGASDGVIATLDEIEAVFEQLGDQIGVKSTRQRRAEFETTS